MKTAEINGKPAFIYESKGAVASAGADKISITHDTEDGYVSILMTKDTACSIERALKNMLH